MNSDEFLLKLGGQYEKSELSSHVIYVNSYQPLNKTVSALLKYPGHVYEAKFMVQEKDEHNLVGSSVIQWGTQPDQSISININHKRGNSPLMDSEFEVGVKFRDLEQIKAGGTLIWTPSKFLAKALFHYGMVPTQKLKPYTVLDICY